MFDKLTESEARRLVKERRLDWGINSGEVVRYCSYCGAYVPIDYYSGEAVINEITYLDICDDCVGRMEKDQGIENFDSDDCWELETCTFCDEPILDDDMVVYNDDGDPYHEGCGLRAGI